MSITKLQIGLAGALAVAGATGFVVQAETNATLREEVAALRRDNAASDMVKAENRQLARNLADAADMHRDDTEFVRLQEEATTLRARLQQVAQQDQQRAAQRQSSVYDVSALDRAPSPRFQARPQYPAGARQAGIGGRVVVDFVIDTNGDVQNARAIHSTVDAETRAVKLSQFDVVTTGDGSTRELDAAAKEQLQREFEAAAVVAVSKWKFKPGTKGGRDVPTHLQVPIVFTVDRK